MKLKKVFTNWRVVLLMILLLLAIVAIRPNPFVEGVSIKNVLANSSASEAGLISPKPNTPPAAKERILFLNNQKVDSVEGYYQIVDSLEANQTVYLKTNKNIYSLKTRGVNGSLEDLGIRVSSASSSNIRKGLDLEGGTRVLLEPEETNEEILDLTIDNLRERLNVYGLTDVIVRKAIDLKGRSFVLVEIAGVTEEEVRDLLAKQGKFEAKIGNQTVFVGGKKHITYVCRSAGCSGIDPTKGCFAVENNQVACAFLFSISLSPEAADNQAKATADLEIISKEGGNYLSKTLDLYLDDKLVDSLQIGAELKGKKTTEVQISGSGLGNIQQAAVYNALENMKKLQTILITGSLPVKLKVIKVETVSPFLGKEFLENAWLVGFLALIGVALVVYLRFRKLKALIPMVLILISEIILLLGFAALVGWNLDLAAIAGIIITLGTGVDYLIIISDETVRRGVARDWKQRIKRAMFIITGSYLTTAAAIIFLWFIGAGMLKGFAFTTLVGLTIGILITRPSYAAIVETLLKEEGGR